MAITNWDSAKTVLGLPDDQETKVEALIPLVEDDYLRIRNKAFEVDDQDEIVYPNGAEFTAIKMIQYHLNNAEGAGISSESLGDHSISYDTAPGSRIDEYPKAVVGGIKRYTSWV